MKMAKEKDGAVVEGMDVQGQWTLVFNLSLSLVVGGCGLSLSLTNITHLICSLISMMPSMVLGTQDLLRQRNGISFIC